ncbi:glycosyltransferase involved in cell wall biosynthesis [Oceanisphaera litoralis]|uniref:glycosyltransferase n=1 Tax=Oceanisphaera litoralis TaxID=225144 RepID=UPI00195D1953|nr:glycosyltransferase [Oceanisphaera litoralis]MBM7455573.1 glycosyltransferase involved in cell wall biosynthesis [Oceanisphaera litoralis]
MTTPMDEQTLRALFNPEWYLKQYPDVAAAGMDPWRHFIHHGMHEHRQPCPVAALALEDELWRGHTQVLSKLHTLAAGKGTDAAVAAWVLARWHASRGEHATAEPLLSAYFAEPAASLLVNHAGPWLLLFGVLWQQDKMQQAAAWLAQPGWPQVPDHALARFMLPDHHTLTTLNAFYQSQGLCPLALHQAKKPLALDNLSAPAVPAAKSSWWRRSPLVSVIMPCFNAEATITTALRSLLQQSWQNLEILVVDDASTDQSAQVVAALAQQDSRIKLLRHNTNQGAYAARNTALAVARGRFITTHDCDDWSHPQKIERQVALLRRHRHVMACTSHWVRCTPELHIATWRQEANWVQRNVSSLMFRRRVRRKLGFWDRVSVNADTEYYYRIIQAFGPAAVAEVMPGVPLAFGRVDANSLTQQNHTHLRTFYEDNGLRRRYHQAAQAWHQGSSRLYMPPAPNQRPFAAPAPMCRGTTEARAHNLTLLAKQSGLFNAGWYLRRYPDVASAGMDPWQHYCRFGYREGRDPGPNFSGSGYQFAVSKAVAENPLLHLLNADQAVGYTPPLHAGQLAPRSECPTLLLCAHQVSEQCYGAERSFLDVLRACTGLPYNLVVALPSAQNAAYVQQIRELCHQVTILPYHWWRAGRTTEVDTVDQFAGLIRQFNIALVYCNTLTLFEPLLAAKKTAVPSITHVRELPEHDAPLCEALQCQPEQIRQHLLQYSDFFIANSHVVANYLNAADRVDIIGNIIDINAFNLPFPACSRLQLGMVSSNLPKKGLHDFVRLAVLLQEQGITVDCVLIGPENEHTQALFTERAAPANLRFAGYLPSPQEAIGQLDVLVNLSHFQESFGRTVLEAMAASRPVVCYEWGALPELVEQGKSGFLAPLGDIAQIAEYVAMLVENEAMRNSMGQAGQNRAFQYYGPHAMQQALAGVLHKLIGTDRSKENI